MTDAGTGVIDIDGDFSRFNRGLRGATKAAGAEGSLAGQTFGRRLTSGLTNVTSDIARVGKRVGIVLGASVGLAVGSLFKSGYDRLVQIQDATSSLTIILGDAAKAGDLVKQVLKVVEGTPFSLPQFTDAAKTLAAFGIDAKKIPGVLTAIGDAAAASGKGAEGVNQITDAFGQIAATGQVSLDQVWRISESGVNALALLANGFGVSTTEMKKMISKGAVPAGKAIDILTTGIEKGSDGVAGHTNALAGTAKALGDTASGAFANMKIALARFGAVLIGPIFKRLPDIFKSISGLIDGLVAKVKVFQLQFVAGWRGVGDSVFSKIGKALKAIVDFFKGDPAARFAALAGVIGGVVLVAVVTLGSALGALLSPVVLAIGGFALLVAGVVYAYKKFTAFRDVVAAVVGFVVDTAIPGIQTAIAGFIAGFQGQDSTGFFGALGNAAHATWDFIVKTAIPGVKAAIGSLIAGFQGKGGEGSFFTDLGEAARKLVDVMQQKVLPVLIPILKTVGDFIKDHLKPILIGLGIGIGLLISPVLVVAGAFVYAYQKFKVFRDVVAAVVGFIENKLIPAFVTLAGFFARDILPPLVSFGKAIVSIVKTAFSFVVATIKNAVKIITGLIEIFSAIIHGDWGELWDGLKKVVTGVWSELGTIIKTGFTLITEIFRGLGPALGKLMSLAWKAVKIAVVAGIKLSIAEITALPRSAAEALANLTATLVGVIARALEAAAKATLTGIGHVAVFFAELPGKVLVAVATLELKLASFLGHVFVTGALAVGRGIVSLVRGAARLPGQVIRAVSTLLPRFVSFVEHLFSTLLQDFLRGMGAIIHLVAGLPGKVISAVSSLTSRLGHLIGQAFTAAKSAAVTGIHNVVSEVGKLPGQIIHIAGDVLSAAKKIGSNILEGIKNGISAVGGFVSHVAGSIWDAIKGFVNDHLIGPIKDFKVGFFGHHFQPFGSLPLLANGMIATSPTIGIFGEAGPEAVIPLSPGKAAQRNALLDRAGLTKGNTVEINGDIILADGVDFDRFLHEIDFHFMAA